MKKKVKKIMKISTPILVVVVVIVFIFGQSCSSATYSSEDVRMQKIEKSSHYEDGKFKNYHDRFGGMGFFKSISVMWNMAFLDNDRKPDVTIPVQQIDFDKIKNAGDKDLQITWVGHSSQIINIDGKIVLTDPVYEEKIVFIGPSRYNGDVPLNMDDIPEIDVVIISHNHYDHLNLPTIKKIAGKVKYFLTPLMVGAELEGAGVPREKIIELDWWEEVTLFDDFLFALTPTQHFSGRSLGDRDETLWGSYVIKGPEHKVFFSGDGGYFEGFKEIGDKYGPFDYTLMECGAYSENWLFVHMLPEESVQAHLDVKGKIMQPMHWGTFSLALHAWYDPMIRVAKKADSLGVTLSTPIVGQTIKVDENLSTERWWEPLVKEEKE